MDFNRTVQPQNVAPSAHTPSSASAGKKNNVNERSTASRAGVVAIVAAVALLLVGAAAYVGLSNNKSTDEGNYVNTNKLQAVFLNTGQVYFGKIEKLNAKYFVLNNIYYLQTASNGSSSTSSSNSSVSLVKLGCELHEPYDKMVINRDQVTFWENLQDNGQVAKAVSTFEKQNPNGQKCADQSSSSSTTNTGTVQNANNGSTTNP